MITDYTLSAEQVGKVLGKPAETIRELARQKAIDYGDAIQSESGKWCFIFYRKALEDKVGEIKEKDLI